MRRTQDKIKDLIEAQSFDEVQNYAGEPARALAAYRFTTDTSDLLARWLDALADLPRNRGAARALAGLRGVGKSHTLAAFSALAAVPDLRSTVADAHVATCARRLLSRPYLITRVERGTRPTLQEELAAAFAEVFGGGEEHWTGAPAQMLAVAASMSGAPFVLTIDTAVGREARVRRDDGALLSELATATQHINAFIALALDDDIEGADGANVGLSETFQIDYLDPEHLYRIADLYLFQKTPQARAALHDIYTTLRTSVSGFNWSEPRFTAIYPVHPIVVDVASAVRLYAPKFAFLPFAAAAGARATNRPAQSLIVLDEVFDRTEHDLRKAEDLKDAFVAYDELATHAITQFPAMQRLQAKLVLKGLFILSLDGRGATARELGAAMLLDDDSPNIAVERIEDMLARFAEALPQGSLQRSVDESETRYRFIISASADFDAALAERACQIAIDSPAISDLLRVVARARFADWPFAGDGKRVSTEADFTVIWRGMGRHGRLAWQASGESHAPLAARLPEDFIPLDWEMVIFAPGVAAGGAPVDGSSERTAGPECSNAPAPAVWRPAQLSAEETEGLRRLIALRTDGALLAEFGEIARAAERTHTALAERIWARIYVDDGELVLNQTAHAFSNKARAASSLTEALTQMLDPLLAARYPQHPAFSEILDEGEAARLVGGLFSGANQGEAGVQELARLFAEPLGLASLRGDTYALEAGDQVLRQPWIREVLALTDDAGGEVVPLEVVYQKLRGEPYGLLREAQYLILTALVAQRRVELVTSTGDRISHRTLDRSLAWGEIAGVARAATLLHSAEELTGWARLLTDQEALASIAEPEAREAVRLALAEWLDAWRLQRLLENFNILPDEGLTTRAWNLAAAVRKSFGVAASAIEAALDDRISLEEGLQRVADAFGDSTATFARNSQQLLQLANFINGLAQREDAHAYLATAEPTSLDEVESARRELLAIADDVHSIFDQESDERFNLLWPEFHARYSEHYVKVHDEAVGGAYSRRPIDIFLRSDKWREFEALSRLSIVSRHYWEEAMRLLDHYKNAHCELPVRQLLARRPTCSCSFRLAHAAPLKNIAQALEDLSERGLEAHRRTLQLCHRHLAHALEALAQQERATETGEQQASSLAATFSKGLIPAPLSLSEIDLIERAIRETDAPPLRMPLPVDVDMLLTRDELGARFRQWLDDLPNYPPLVEIIGESGSDAA